MIYFNNLYKLANNLKKASRHITVIDYTYNCVSCQIVVHRLPIPYQKIWPVKLSFYNLADHAHDFSCYANRVRMSFNAEELTAFFHMTDIRRSNMRQVIESFKKLSDKIGSDHIGWRYDPILIHGKYTVSYHIRAFEKMCSLLEGYTHLCVFSFLDLYQKTKKNLPGARKVTREEQEEIAKAFFAISSKHNIVLNGCHEDRFLENYGIQMGGCLTKEIFEKQLHVRLETPKGYVPPREGCACLLSNDIGAYQSCLHRLPQCSSGI